MYDECNIDCDEILSLQTISNEIKNQALNLKSMSAPYLMLNFEDLHIDFFYHILNVKQSDSIETRKASYKSLSKFFHPDKHPNASCAERKRWIFKMQCLNAAKYEIIDEKYKT